MIAYTGIETISNMAEEAKDEIKTIPAAIKRVAIAVFAIYFTLPAVALVALPVERQPDGTYSTLLGLPEDQGGYAGDPIAGVVSHLNLGALQRPAEIYVGILAATILFLATNAGLIGVSRLVYSMGIHRQLPDRLRELHPRFRTPWIGIIAFGVVAILITLPGQAEFLGYLYAFGAMLSFTIAHSAVIRLRFAHPELPRPYRAPGNVTIAGKDVPVFAFLGGFGTLAALIVTIALHPAVAITGVCWLCLGVVVYLVYRRSQGLDLASTHKVAIAQPVVDHEAEYDSVLVPLGDALRRVGDRHGGQARRPQAARDPRDRDGHGAERAEDRRADARGDRGGRVADRAGAAAGRRARVRARRARAQRPGGAADHRGGGRHARGGDRDAAAAAHQRQLDLRQDARDRARRAARAG